MDMKMIAIMVLTIAVIILLKFYCSSINEINHITELYNLAMKTAKQYRETGLKNVEEISKLKNTIRFYEDIYISSEKTRQKLKKELDEIKKGM